MRALLISAADPAALIGAGRSFQSIKALGKKEANVLDVDTSGSGYLFDRKLYDVVALNIGGSQFCKYWGHFWLEF